MKIAIITPSSPCDPDALQKGLDILAGWGHTILYSPFFYREADRYNAGSPGIRISEMDWALQSRADLILAARGGYGAHQILPAVNGLMDSAPPTPLLGFSDITALHQLWLIRGWPAYHGPNVTTLGKLDAASLEATKAFFDGAYQEVPATRPLIGGNLAMLASLAGTPYLYQPKEPHALFLEDIGERPYRLDRFLQQLLMAGYFDRVTQVYLGEFKDCEPGGGADYSALDVVQEFFARKRIPCQGGFPTGHGSVNRPILLD